MMNTLAHYMVSLTFVTVAMIEILMHLITDADLV